MQGPLDQHGAGDEVDVGAVESEDLAPPQSSPGGQHHGGPVLLGDGLGEYGYLVDVGDAALC